MPTPLLLVSVRNRAEAIAAVEGGCDLLDVKEPLHGPLGMADAAVIDEVADFALGDTKREPIPCSVALGEMIEWSNGRPRLTLPAGILYAKLGPANVDTPHRWLEEWRRARRSIEPIEPLAVNWVAVAYADWAAAGSVSPRQVLQAAGECDCKMFLIDTFRKQGANIFDALRIREIERLADRARRAGMRLAIAGGLKSPDFDVLRDVCPDVIAVRGAACEGQLRSAAVSSAIVRQLKRSIAASFKSRDDDGVPVALAANSVSDCQLGGFPSESSPQSGTPGG